MVNVNRKLILCGIAISFVCLVNAVNILVLEEVPSPSHHIWFRSLTNALASKGYNVTALSPDEDVSTANLHYIHMERVYYDLYSNEDEQYNYVEMGERPALEVVMEFSKMGVDVCTSHVSSNGWKQLENYPDNFKFDLIIYDYVMGGCLIAFVNKFKDTPIIGATAYKDNFKLNSFAGTATIPSINPYPFVNSNPTTFLGRTFNFILHMADKIMVDFHSFPKTDAIIRESTSFKNSPSVSELGKRTVIYLTNYDPSLDGIQQLSPNVIPVGGLQIKPAKTLPEDLQSLADGATNGLILFSLGTNVQCQMLGNERITMILEAFRKLSRYTFLWKIDAKEFPVPLPSNVFVRKWVPQNDILGHKNTKLFITHSGLLSTQESVYHGVPMLGIPIFADQFINVRSAVNRGLADVLYVKDISTERLYTKILNMLTQSKYRETMQLASATFRDQKEKPLERAMWWIDWVLRNPNPIHLRPEHNLNFLRLESFDVIAFITTMALITLYAIVWFAKIILNCIRGTRKSSKSKKE